MHLPITYGTFRCEIPPSKKDKNKYPKITIGKKYYVNLNEIANGDLNNVAIECIESSKNKEIA